MQGAWQRRPRERDGCGCSISSPLRGHTGMHRARRERTGTATCPVSPQPEGCHLLPCEPGEWLLPVPRWEDLGVLMFGCLC